MLKKVLRSAIALLQKPKQLSIERAVALATPVFAVVSAWLAGAAAKYGIHLDKTGVTVAFGVGATAAVTAAWKWLDGRSKFVNAVHSLVVEAHRAGLNASVIGQLESLIGAATSIAPALELPSAVADPVPAATAPMMPAATLPSDVQEAAVQPPAQVTEPATVIPSVTG